MTREQKATELFLKGYNCSQSVFTAFCDRFNLDEQTALRISAGLGGGVGRQRDVCGAVTGAAMVLGSVCAGVEADDNESKMENYALVSQFCDDFRCRHNSIICKELLADIELNMFGISDGTDIPQYYKDRPCLKLVQSAVQILEEKIK